MLMLLAAVTAAQVQKPSWTGWEFLMGTWMAEEGSGGQPGQATKASAAFKLDLQRQVLVRTDHSEYPATRQRPAFAHDGLMVIYVEGDGFRADSWDNEGHVIRYAATADGKRAVFLSDLVARQPRYRLTYSQTEPGAVTVRFEIAPPDKPDDFRVYVEGKTRKAR